MTCSNRSADASIPHGSVEGYTNHECNCPPCSEAWRVYMADYRAKNRVVINARRRARRRFSELVARGEPADLEALVEEELGEST